MTGAHDSRRRAGPRPIDSRHTGPGHTGPRHGPGLALGGVLLAVAVGLARVAQDHWRQGLFLVGGALLAAALLRLLLPVRQVGLLAVRSRPFDVVLLAGLGVGIILITSIVPLPQR